MSDPVNESGLFASLRRLLATALEMAQVRLDLLGTEIELEKRRLFNGLLWGSIALMMLGMGLVLLCGFVILLFWEGYRLAATGGMTLLFLSGGATLLYKARQHLKQKAGIFNASMSELERDLSGLKAPEQHEQR
jgi:uncharacterized membrane protein YqjE